MEVDKIVKTNKEFTTSSVHKVPQINIGRSLNEVYLNIPKFRRLETDEDLDYWRVPYTIEEIISIRKKIDTILQSKQELAFHQSVTLLNQLYTKISFKMALLTLIRSKPIGAVKAIGLLIIALSLGGFLLNIIFREPLISPFLVLYFFYFGLIMTIMAIIERVQIRKQRNAI